MTSLKIKTYDSVPSAQTQKAQEIKILTEDLVIAYRGSLNINPKEFKNWKSFFWYLQTTKNNN